MQLPSDTRPIGSSFFELQSVDSSNNYALGKIHEGMACHGDCFFAHEQTMGKGQRGKSWLAEPSSNILLSIALQPRLQVNQQFQLSVAAAVSVHTFISRWTGDDARIKWPNDIYWKDRKLGGILIENVVSSGQPAGSWLWAVVGIGININQTKFPAGLTNPVSLKQISGKTYDVVTLAKELCACFSDHYRSLENDGFAALLEQYNEFLYKKNEVVKLKKEHRIFEATIRSVNSSGQLIARHAIEEQFNFGEVEWLI